MTTNWESNNFFLKKHTILLYFITSYYKEHVSDTKTVNENHISNIIQLDMGKKLPDKLNHNTILNESNIRSRMKDFSTAIWKSEVNTDLLLTEDPWDISYTQFGGNQEDKMKMSNFCEYLEFVKMITKDENVYKEQFLKPVE